MRLLVKVKGTVERTELQTQELANLQGEVIGKMARYNNTPELNPGLGTSYYSVSDGFKIIGTAFSK